MQFKKKFVILYQRWQEIGSIAQLGEHLPYKQGVIGSSPIVPTNNLPSRMREWLSGRALPCQGKCREFESRFPLHFFIMKFWRHRQVVRLRSAKPSSPVQIWVAPPLKNCFACRGGEIGRRKGLKIPRGKLRIGSSPIPGTKKTSSIFTWCFFYFTYFYFEIKKV